MKLPLSLCALLLSMQLIAEPRQNQPAIDALGSATLGAGIGAVAAAVLLIKDAVVGVCLSSEGPLGKELWGRERAIPLFILVTSVSVLTGISGYMHEINMLDRVYERIFE